MSKSFDQAKPSKFNSVAMVIQTFYPNIGGAEKQCLVLSKALQERGVNVNVLIERKKGFPKSDHVEGVPVTRLGWGGTTIWNSISFMLSTFIYLLMHAGEYEIIHVHLAASHAVAAGLAGKICKKKVAVLLGGGKGIGEIALSSRTFAGRLKLWALGRLKPHFIILSETQKEELLGFGLENVPTSLIPNGVDIRVYRRATPKDKNLLRQKLGWQGLIFLYTGRFSNEKIKTNFFKSFLSGWALAIQGKKGFHFYLVGQGPLEKEYREIIGELGLQDSIHLLPARDNVSELYQAADVFVLPTSTEGLSNSLLEAMASSLPVMASRVPGIVDMVQDNVHGYLFNPESSGEVRKCLEKIIDEPANLEIMGENSGNLALKYSIDKTVERYIDFYGMLNVQ